MSTYTEHVPPIENVEKLLEEIPYLTADQLTSILGKGKRTIERKLPKLEARGRITSVKVNIFGHSYKVYFPSRYVPKLKEVGWWKGLPKTLKEMFEREEYQVGNWNRLG